jgi:hypothetical protein
MKLILALSFAVLDGGEVSLSPSFRFRVLYKFLICIVQTV